MDYKALKKSLSSDNKNLLKYINKEEIKWLNKHFLFIISLLMGRVKPSEKKYENFVDVIKNKKEPTSEPEKIYLKFCKYYDEVVEKSKIKQKDPNILFDGMENIPAGVRPGTKKGDITYVGEGSGIDWEWGW